MEQILKEKFDLLLKSNNSIIQEGLNPIDTNEIKTLYLLIFPKRIYNLDMYQKDTITFRDLLFIAKSEKYHLYVML